MKCLNLKKNLTLKYTDGKIKLHQPQSTLFFL